MKTARKRFRKIEEQTAVQFTGDWSELANAIGVSLGELVERWPHTPQTYDKSGRLIFDSDGTRMPMPIEPGQWVLLDGKNIVGFASENTFDGWEQMYRA